MRAAKVYLLLIIGFFIFSCTSKYSKTRHEGTTEILSDLYEESYLVYSGGTLANDSYSYYLTDSINFRKYIGTIYFDDEHLFCKMLDSNSVLVYSVNRYHDKDTLEMKKFSLKELKEEGRFE